MAESVLSLRSPSVFYGIAGSLAVIAVLAIFSGMGAEALIEHSMVYYALLFLISILAGLTAGQRQKHLNGGYLPFHNALLTIFTSMVIIGFVYNVANYFIYNVINPELGMEMKALLTEQMEQTLLLDGENKEETKALIEQFRKKDHELTLLNAFTGWLIWMAVGFVISLIMASIIRKESSN